MELPPLPFTVTDWSQVPPTHHSGETGTAEWRSFTLGDIRIRQVTYSPGYLADHWCQKGHVLFVLSGELETELADGRVFRMGAGHSYQVADGAEAHRSRTETGATLFIVD